MTDINDITPIILAAGKGTRMGAKFSNAPKSFVEISGKKIIEIQLDALIRQGFKKVIIVIGYLKEKFFKELGYDYKNLTIQYIINDKFNYSGSAYSLFLASDLWKKKKKDVLMLHADIYFEVSILEDFLLKSLNKKNFILLDKNYSEETNDEQLIIGENNLVHSLIKGKPKKELNVGESIGMNFWTTEFMEQYFSFLSNFLKENQEINWEQSIRPFLNDHSTIELFYEDIGNRLWKNINYLDDLKNVKEMYKT